MLSQLDFARPVRGPIRWVAAWSPRRVSDLARGFCAVFPPRRAFALSASVASCRGRRDRKYKPQRLRGLSCRPRDDMCKVELSLTVSFASAAEGDPAGSTGIAAASG